MTNEEKVKEIVNGLWQGTEDNDAIVIGVAIVAAKQMADWKDERIKQLEQALIESSCHCEELQMQNEELNAELGHCYDRIQELVAKISEYQK